MVMRDALTNRGHRHNLTTDGETTERSIEATETATSDGSRKSATTRLRETQGHTTFAANESVSG